MDAYQVFCEGVIENIKTYIANYQQDQHAVIDGLHFIASIAEMSEMYILDALEGSYDNEDNVEVQQNILQCRQKLIDELHSIPELEPTERAFSTMENFLQDVDVPLDFPDLELLHLISLINITDGPHPQTDNDSSEEINNSDYD